LVRRLVRGEKRCQRLAESWLRIPLRPERLRWPVVLIASLHLALNAPECVVPGSRARLLHGLVQGVVSELPRIENARAYAMTGPGLGTALLPGLKQRTGVTVKRSEWRIDSFDVYA